MIVKNPGVAQHPPNVRMGNFSGLLQQYAQQPPNRNPFWVELGTVIISDGIGNRKLLQ